MLPTGASHVVFRVDDVPLRLYDGAKDEGRLVGCAVVGGARSRFYVRDASRPASSVGAQLHPGAGSLLLGVPGEELAERHVALANLWGGAAEESRARIAEAGSLEAQLDVFESILAERLPRVRRMHPAVAGALARLVDEPGEEVGALVAHSGFSHRRFIALFRDTVGLTPKRFARVLRFQSALAAFAAGRVAAIEVALSAGYSDQAHFHREFVEFAGVTPGLYRAVAPASPNHVPLR